MTDPVVFNLFYAGSRTVTIKGKLASGAYLRRWRHLVLSASLLASFKHVVRPLWRASTSADTKAH
jgi:hypothetical protein